MQLRRNRGGCRHSRRVDLLAEENKVIHVQIRRGEKTVRYLREDRNYRRHRVEELQQRISRALVPPKWNVPDHDGHGHNRRRRPDEWEEEGNDDVERDV